MPESSGSGKGPENRFFPCFIALGPAEGISIAQQKHIEGSGTRKRGGRADRSSQNTGPRRVFLTRHGHGQRAGRWEGADLGVALARGVSKKKARYLLLRQRCKKHRARQASFYGTGTRAGGVTPLTSREEAPRRGKKDILDPRFSL